MKAKFLFILCIVFINVSAQLRISSLEPFMGFGTSQSVQFGKNNIGGNIGCGLVFMFNDHFDISSGLQVQRYSTKVTTGKDSVNVTYGLSDGTAWDVSSVNVNYNFTYLELPLLARYVSSKCNKLGLFAEGGIVIGYLISGNETGTINPARDEFNLYPIGIGSFSSTELPATTFSGIKPNASPFNFAGHAAFGVIIPISDRCSIITDVSINKGFTNVGNSSKDVINVEGYPFYYYNKNVSVPSVTNYGAAFSGLLSVRLNIKLGGILPTFSGF